MIRATRRIDWIERGCNMDRVVVVCDDCERPAVTTIKIRVNDRTFDKDLCQKDLDGYLVNARRPKKGKRKGQFA